MEILIVGFGIVVVAIIVRLPVVIVGTMGRLFEDNSLDAFMDQKYTPLRSNNVDTAMRVIMIANFLLLVGFSLFWDEATTDTAFCVGSKKS